MIFKAEDWVNNLAIINAVSIYLIKITRPTISNHHFLIMPGNVDIMY